MLFHAQGGVAFAVDYVRRDRGQARPERRRQNLACECYNLQNHQMGGGGFCIGQIPDGNCAALDQASKALMM